MVQHHLEHSSVEVVIVGAGPSGTTLAAHLAAKGHEVILLDSQDFPRWAVGESLTPKILDTLERTGVRRRIEEAGFNRMTGHAHLWESDALIKTSFEDGIGFQVDRALFDNILKDNAVEQGAIFQPGVTVLGTTLEGERITGVEWQDDTGRRDTLSARLVVDATGGAGVLSRQHGLRYPLAWPQTIAMVGYLKGPDDVGTETLVEAFDDGWIWSFLLADGRRGISLFLDPDRARDAAGTNLTDNWLKMLRDAKTLRGYLAQASIVARPVSCSVAWYSSETRSLPGLLVIGDAADFVDPISSQGVFRAMDGAHRAAIAADHILQDESRRASIAYWYDSMEDQSSSVYTEQMQESYEAVGAWQKSDFFARRIGLNPRIKGVPLPSERATIRDHLKMLGKQGQIPSAVFRCQGELTHHEGMTLEEGNLMPCPHVASPPHALTVAVPEALSDRNWLSAIHQELPVRDLIAHLSLNEPQSRESCMEFLVEMCEAGILKVETHS